MGEKLNHVPNENDAAMAVVESREAARDAGLYRKDTYGVQEHQLVGPASGPNFYIRTEGRPGKFVRGDIRGQIYDEGRHISTNTELGRYGDVESQSIRLSRREAGGKWKELTSDNPLVVRLAEVAIANRIKKVASETPEVEKLKRAA